MAENAKSTVKSTKSTGKPAGKPSGKKDQPKSSQVWLKGVQAEFGKIIWTDRPTLIKQTVVVTIVTIVLGILISIMDAGILQILNLLIR